MPYIVKGCKHLHTCMGGSLLFPRFLRDYFNLTANRSPLTANR